MFDLTRAESLVVHGAYKGLPASSKLNAALQGLVPSNRKPKSVSNIDHSATIPDFNAWVDRSHDRRLSSIQALREKFNGVREADLLVDGKPVEVQSHPKSGE